MYIQIGAKIMTLKRKKVIGIIRQNKNLKIIKIGRGWIDVKSLTNGITMRWWNFMWDILTETYNK